MIQVIDSISKNTKLRLHSHRTQVQKKIRRGVVWVFKVTDWIWSQIFPIHPSCHSPRMQTQPDSSANGHVRNAPAVGIRESAVLVAYTRGALMVPQSQVEMVL